MLKKEEKKTAFQTLMKVAIGGSISLHAYKEDIYKGGRRWPVDWAANLTCSHFRTETDRQFALNHTLERLVCVDFPSSVKQMNKEKRLARLVLRAGADPNFHSSLYDMAIFDQFLIQRKSHIALEIAKTDGFIGPQNSEKAFYVLSDTLAFYLNWKQPYPGNTEEETGLHMQNCADRKDLVYLLFQKGLYPRNETVFEKLVPIVQEKDPNFFEKKKQQIAVQIQRAKTPLEIYNVLKGQGKEKS